MVANTPIDEYIFWKNIIEAKQELGESVPDMMHELLEQAQKKTMYYLMEKYSISNSVNDYTVNEQASLH